MTKTTITEKENKLLDYLINKVLVEKKTLTKEEHSQLKAILLKLNKIEEEETEKRKKSVLGFSEVVSHSMSKVLARKALKEQEVRLFNEQPLQLKHQQLKEQIEALKSSQLAKFGEEQQRKERAEKEKAEFEKWYSDYTKKHGKSL